MRILNTEMTKKKSKKEEFIESMENFEGSKPWHEAMLPIISKVFSKSITKDIISVQPMKWPEKEDEKDKE